MEGSDALICSQVPEKFGPLWAATIAGDVTMPIASATMPSRFFESAKRATWPPILFILFLHRPNRLGWHIASMQPGCAGHDVRNQITPRVRTPFDFLRSSSQHRWCRRCSSMDFDQGGSMNRMSVTASGLGLLLLLLAGGTAHGQT